MIKIILNFHTNNYLNLHQALRRNALKKGVAVHHNKEKQPRVHAILKKYMALPLLPAESIPEAYQKVKYQHLQSLALCLMSSMYTWKMSSCHHTKSRSGVCMGKKTGLTTRLKIYIGTIRKIWGLIRRLSSLWVNNHNHCQIHQSWF